MKKAIQPLMKLIFFENRYNIPLPFSPLFLYPFSHHLLLPLVSRGFYISHKQTESYLYCSTKNMFPCFPTTPWYSPICGNASGGKRNPIFVRTLPCCITQAKTAHNLTLINKMKREWLDIYRSPWSGQASVFYIWALFQLPISWYATLLLLSLFVAYFVPY